MGAFHSAIVAANRQLGPELCVNGTMDSVATPWSNGSVSPAGALVRSIENGRLKCVTSATLKYGYALQILSLKLGRYYQIKADIEAVSVPLKFFMYNYNNFSNLLFSDLITSGTTVTITRIVRLARTQYINFGFEFNNNYGSNVDGGIAYIDNVSVKEVYPS